MVIFAGLHTVRTRPALGLIVVLTMAASFAAPGPAAAVAPPATRPLVTGVHYLIDNRVSPGATCIYPDTSYSSQLLRIVIRPPVVFGADRRDGRIDRQRVGWRYVIQGGAADGQYSGTGRASTIHTAFATDHAPAEFTFRRWRAHASNYRMRVLIKIFWYRDGQIVGRSRLVPRYYAYQPMGETFKDGCNG
jgi:hypothetical protein